MGAKHLYYALKTPDGFLAKDAHSNQLEIYESEADAEREKRHCTVVVGVYIYSEKEHSTTLDQQTKGDQDQ